MGALCVLSNFDWSIFLRFVPPNTPVSNALEEGPADVD